MRSWWPLVVVAVLLVLVGGATAMADPQLTRVPVPVATRQAEEFATQPAQRAVEFSPTPTDEPARVSMPAWLVPLLGVVLAAIVVAGLLSVLWLMIGPRIRSRTGRIDEADPLVTTRPGAAAEEVAAIVDLGLTDLSDTDLDPRRAVIACWLRLEEVAAAAGTPRQVADTPTDLVTRLLAEHQVEPVTLAAFAAIYRRARYATHTVDEQMRGQARTALEQVRSALTGVVV